jgi:hypothetical protein
VGAAGFELSQKSPGIPMVSSSDDAESGVRPSTRQDLPCDTDLTRVVMAWAELPPAIRAAVIALMESTLASRPGPREDAANAR